MSAIISKTEVASALGKMIADAEMPGVDSTTAYHAASLYGRWQNPGSGTVFAFGQVRDQIGPDDMAKVIQLMNRMGAGTP